MENRPELCIEGRYSVDTGGPSRIGGLRTALPFLATVPVNGVTNRPNGACPYRGRLQQEKQAYGRSFRIYPAKSRHCERAGLGQGSLGLSRTQYAAQPVRACGHVRAFRNLMGFGVAVVVCQSLADACHIAVQRGFPVAPVRDPA